MTIVTVNHSYSEHQQQRAWVNINHQALINNVQELKNFLNPETQLMAVIKADAYGHGAVKVAKTILQSGVDSLAIATLSEGIELREGGITAPILILGAINTADEVKEIVKYDLEPTLCTPSQTLIFAETLEYLKATLPVHLKLDTGMSRLGTHWHNAVDFVKYIQQFPQLHLSSIYSHLATADDVNTSIMALQHSRFEEAISALKVSDINIPRLHLANSAGTLSDRNLHYDMVRVGLALYGISPAPHLKDKVKLQPALEVKARITQIKTLPPHTGVSYSHTFKCDRPIKIAVVGIGYADGIPRLLSNKMKVIIQGKFADQIGNITMDQIMLNITDFPYLEVGEIVTLLGKEGSLEITADDWANTIGTISWEILCSFKHRLPRVNNQ
jgi:alanine racemase